MYPIDEDSPTLLGNLLQFLEEQGFVTRFDPEEQPMNHMTFFEIEGVRSSWGRYGLKELDETEGAPVLGYGLDETVWVLVGQSLAKEQLFIEVSGPTRDEVWLAGGTLLEDLVNREVLLKPSMPSHHSYRDHVEVLTEEGRIGRIRKRNLFTFTVDFGTEGGQLTDRAAQAVVWDCVSIDSSEQ